MVHFDSMCCSFPINPKVIFYDGNFRKFYDRKFNILCRHKIQYLILRDGDYVHNQPNYNGPNMKLNNLNVNTRMNWMRHHGTLKFSPPHMNSVLFETWEVFELSSSTITHNYFKNKHLTPLSTTDIGTNHQAFIAGA